MTVNCNIFGHLGIPAGCIVLRTATVLIHRQGRQHFKVRDQFEYDIGLHSGSIPVGPGGQMSNERSCVCKLMYTYMWVHGVVVSYVHVKEK